MEWEHDSIRMPMHIAIRIVTAVLFSGTAFGQAFDLADVHASPRSLHPHLRAGLRDGRFEIRTATMADLIAAALGVEPDKVAGGPNWLDMDRFDITAKVPAGATLQTLRPMLQALLKERFGLTVHMDQRPMAAYVLSTGQGKPKLKQSEGSGPPGCQPQAAEVGPVTANCRGLTMEAFAQQLRGLAGDYLTSAVVDKTGLEGPWDFTLKWTPRERLVAAGSEGINIFDAIGNQLGLKLQLQQAPTPVVVVDRVNEQPTENPPGVASGLPPSPAPRFEVATIKPTDPRFQGVRVQTPPDGLVNIRGVTMSFLIQTIWFITPDMIAGAPKWLDTARWDIEAKAPSAPGSPPQMDMDSLIAMTRELIEDRFKLKTHIEQRVVPAYTLTASKPKLRRAEPANRTGCKEGPGADGKDPRVTNPALSRLVTCHNVSMAQFVEFLPNIANALNPLNGAIRSAVLDSTGLAGTWDFTLSFSPTMGVGPVPADAGAGPTDPNGEVSIFDAVSSQLGLRLSLEKRPAPVLVIDHIEDEPTDN